RVDRSNMPRQSADTYALINASSKATALSGCRQDRTERQRRGRVTEGLSEEAAAASMIRS
ncbi:MAG: hypothetical protein ACRECN_03275, partial [Methylocella sp.]